jgi:hypothetical protein
MRRPFIVQVFTLAENGFYRRADAVGQIEQERIRRTE